MHVFKRYNTVSKEELKSLVGKKNGSDGHLFGHQGQEEAANQAPVAQLDRATDYESVCRGFESLRARQMIPSG
jgi:hypothetical protein